MIPGVSIRLAGQEYTVPPLTLGQLRRFLPRIQELAGISAGNMGEAQLAMMVEVVTAALQRNYPDMTAQAAENLLDLGNAVPVLNAILAGSQVAAKLAPPEATYPLAAEQPAALHQDMPDPLRLLGSGKGQ